MFKSTAVPTGKELAVFAKLSRKEQQEFIESELDRGLNSGVSDKSVDDILKEVKSRHRRQAL